MIKIAKQSPLLLFIKMVMVICAFVGVSEIALSVWFHFQPGYSISKVSRDKELLLLCIGQYPEAGSVPRTAQEVREKLRKVEKLEPKVLQFLFLNQPSKNWSNLDGYIRDLSDVVAIEPGAFPEIHPRVQKCGMADTLLYYYSPHRQMGYFSSCDGGVLTELKRLGDAKWVHGFDVR